MSPQEIENVYDTEEPTTARSILLPFAEAGDPVAQFYMGHLCDEDEPSDKEAALGWYRKSSEGGFLDGTHFLASFTYYGFGTAQDIDEALRLFRSAAEAGLADSQWKLGQHLLSVSPSRDEAISWLKRAASQGHPAAIELLQENQW